jgi:hypothetical protein
MKKELIENNKILLWENRKQKEIIDKVYKYLERKKDIPEWWDTDFMICMDMLKGGDGNLSRIFDEMSRSDKE